MADRHPNAPRGGGSRRGGDSDRGGFKAAPATIGKVPALALEMDVDLATWNALCTSVFPGAHEDSVVAVISYCKARALDPLKKPCHIVPMKVKDAKTGKEEWRDVIMPGIYEHRTTAHRTMQYLGRSAPRWGDDIKYLGVIAPEWCELTVYRQAPPIFGPDGQPHYPPVQEWVHREYFLECVQTTGKGGDERVNSMWTRRKRGQLLKCTEAGALRVAFPDELGGVPVREEIDSGTDGRTFEGEVVQPARAEQLAEKLDGGKSEKGPESAQEARDEAQPAEDAGARPEGGQQDAATETQAGGDDPPQPTGPEAVAKIKVAKDTDELDECMAFLSSFEWGATARQAIKTAEANARLKFEATS